jgi:hypothetical protein
VTGYFYISEPATEAGRRDSDKDTEAAELRGNPPDLAMPALVCFVRVAVALSPIVVDDGPCIRGSRLGLPERLRLGS